MKKTQAPGEEAMENFILIEKYFDGQATVEEIARQAKVSSRTVWRWIKGRRENGIKGLCRKDRSDRGKRRKVQDDLKRAIEGLYLRTPKPTAVWVHEQVIEICKSLPDMQSPSFTVVWEICSDLDNRLKVLAHEGDNAYEQEYDILIRREAERPNEVWQSDHKEIDIWAKDDFGLVGKVWLTCIIDDYSRVIPGYFLDVKKPNSTKIASALRQGVWVKGDEKWTVCGIPDVFYSDQGRDFKSTHIAQAAADLGMKLVRTRKRKPRGRGKIERFFRTVDQRFSKKHKSSKSKPISLRALTEAFHEWLFSDYHFRKHREIKMTPMDKWSQAAFLPRLPDSLESLDLMLQKVGKSRKMGRDGIRFKNFKYSDMTLSESVGQEFSIRYDPRDLSAIYVYGEEGKLFCKATCAELAGSGPTPEAIIEERSRIKKKLKKEISERRQAASLLLQDVKPTQKSPEEATSQTECLVQKMKLRKYFHERN